MTFINKNVFQEMGGCLGPGVCDARHIRDLDTLALVAKTLTTRTDQNRMLRDVLALLEQRRGMLHCTIMLLTPDGKELVLEAESTGGADGGARYRRGEGVTGRVLEAGETIIVPLVSEEPRFQFKVHQRTKSPQRDVSFICVPIRLENEVIGTLAADLAAQESSRLQETAQLLEIIASLISNDVSARRMARVECELLEAENRRLLSQVQEKFRPANMVGESGEMKTVFARVHQVATADTTVLIRGESGTGKELIARVIHTNSPFCEEPFITLDCAAVVETLLESELFGHEAGAFTGATHRKKGKIELAAAGTLFLDEVGELPPGLQGKFLGFLQRREYTRVGGHEPLLSRCRIVAATNRDLAEMTRRGEFREDLFFRLRVVTRQVPSLRERLSDIPDMVNHFLHKINTELGTEVSKLQTGVIDRLMAHHWKGNVRDLENVLVEAVVRARGRVILLDEIEEILGLNQPPSAAGPSPHSLDDIEKEHIQNTLSQLGWNRTRSAQALGISMPTLRSKIRKYGIIPPADAAFS